MNFWTILRDLFRIFLSGKLLFHNFPDIQNFRPFLGILAAFGLFRNFWTFELNFTDGSFLTERTVRSWSRTMCDLNTSTNGCDFWPYLRRYISKIKNVRNTKSCLLYANWVSFDFNVAYLSRWGYSLINTLKFKKKNLSPPSEHVEGEQWRLETGPACRRWEGVLAGQATRGWFDMHHIECARVQSPGVCTQSMMSTVYIRSDLTGRRQTDHGCRYRDRISPDRTCWSSTCECYCYIFVLSNSCLAPMAPRQFWGSKSGDHRNNPRCRQRTEMHAHYMHISVKLLVSLLDFVLSICLPLRSALFKCEWWSLKRRVMTTYSAYVHIWCTIELSIGIQFNSSVEHLYTTCIFLPCLHRSKYEQQMMDNSCLRWWRVFSTYTACLHVW